MPDDTERGGKQGSPLTHLAGYFLSALGVVLMLVAGFCTLMFGRLTLDSLLLVLGFAVVPFVLGIGLYMLGTRMIRR